MKYQDFPKNEKNYNGSIYSLKAISNIVDTYDGVSFSANLYKDNKIFAIVFDDGWGGPLMYNFKTNEVLTFEEQEDLACEVVYPLLDAHITTKYIKEWQENHIVLSANTMLARVPIKINGKKVSMLKLQSSPMGVSFLKKTIKKYVEDGYKCLNTNIDVALLP